MENHEPAHSKEFVEDLQRYIAKLESENKLFRGQLEACEQHNKILCEQKVGYLQEIERLKSSQRFAISESIQLREENQRLKAEVLREKFPPN